MRTFRWALAAALWVTLPGCTDGTGPGNDDEAPEREYLGVGIAPNDPIVSVGDAVSFRAKRFYSDTTNEDVTAEVTWISTEARVATIGADGVATALAEGATDIISTDASGVSTKVTLTVRGSSAPIQLVEIQPGTIVLREGESVQLQAHGTYADGEEGNVSAACAWSTDDAGVAAVDAGGLLSASRSGQTRVRADCGDATADASVTIESANADLGLPDITLADFEVWTWGADVTLIATVRNDGDALVGGFFVDAFLDTPEPKPGDEWDETTWINALGPGEETVVFIDLYSLAPGDHVAWLYADADEGVAESDERNNEIGPERFAIEDASGPNLTVSYFEGVFDGSFTAYYLELTNEGGTGAGPFWVDIWTDRLDDPGLCETGDLYGYVEWIGPGETITWEPTIEAGPSIFWWDSVVFVDSCDDVAEDDESDNFGFAYLEAE